MSANHEQLYCREHNCTTRACAHLRHARGFDWGTVAVMAVCMLLIAVAALIAGR